eukprot:scaffold317_cov260-Pinguiococcus_pyrenoidosus.AAC.31
MDLRGDCRRQRAQSPWLPCAPGASRKGLDSHAILLDGCSLLFGSATKPAEQRKEEWSVIHDRAVANGQRQYIDPETGFQVWTALALQENKCCGAYRTLGPSLLFLPRIRASELRAEGAGIVHMGARSARNDERDAGDFEELRNFANPLLFKSSDQAVVLEGAMDNLR